MAKGQRGSRPSAKADPGAGTGIRLTGPALRLREARAEHEKLLRRIAKAAEATTALEDGIRAAEQEAARHTVPLLEEAERLDGAIHGLFEKILGRKRGQKARRRLRDLYRALQADQVLSYRADPVEEEAAEEAAAGPDFFPSEGRAGGPFGGAFGGAFGGRGGPRQEVEAPSAVRPVDRGVLRDLYRRLVGALHPDQVQDATEQARRTELMKDVTVAFREGDYARLIAIERSLAVSNAGLSDEASAAPEELAARLDVVEEENLILRRQVRDAEHRLRDLRRTPMGHFVDEQLRPARGTRKAKAAKAGEAGKAADVSPIGERVTREVGELRRVHALLERFHGGKVSLDDLIADIAPPSFGLGIGLAMGDFDDLMGDFFDLFGSEFGFFGGKRRRRRRRRS